MDALSGLLQDTMDRKYHQWRTKDYSMGGVRRRGTEEATKGVGNREGASSGERHELPQLGLGRCPGCEAI